ncbi:MAG: diacylglycerol kinase [Synechococcaceae cyanobacterium SM1_2_3]|jgi:diacylglycerol kinase|nr:diacylglycerol kinase [Synechococcaceae cyanobacterium SM1_2_3]
MRNKFLGTGESGYHPLRKIKIIWSGLRFAVFYDFSVAYKMVLSLIILTLALLFQEWIDFELLLLATGLVLIAEMFNSAIEAVCDFLETRENEKIRAIKDIAAAAVGISMALWLTVVISDLARLTPLLLQYWRN